jgi:hypothetical protein
MLLNIFLIKIFRNYPQEQIRLNNSDTIPFIKKRVKGRGGFRFYFLLIIKDEILYLIMFVHPKSGSLGFDNITDESKTILYKKVLESIKIDNVYVMSVINEKLSFVKR